MSRIIGVLCGPQVYSYLLIDGSRKSATVSGVTQRKVPKGFEGGERLSWALQEVEKVLRETGVQQVIIKANESIAKSTGYDDRLELETVVVLAAHKQGIQRVAKKRRATAARDLGQKGKVPYLAQVDTTGLTGYEALRGGLAELALVTWSAMPDA